MNRPEMQQNRHNSHNRDIRSMPANAEVLDARAILSRHGLHAVTTGPVSELLQWLILGADSRGDNLFLGGRGSSALMGLSRALVPWDQVLSCQFGSNGESEVASRWPEAACGLVGILAYDDLTRDFKPRLSKCWAVETGLEFDVGREVVSGKWPTHLRAAALARIDDLLARAVESAAQAGGVQALSPASPKPEAAWAIWQPHCEAKISDEEYLGRAAQVIEFIREGRFYQLNLLRFFELTGKAPPGWPCNRIEVVGGPWSALIDIDEAVRVVSFSPEQFIAISSNRIETFPVKGTIARESDPVKDAAKGQSLLESAKDLAELHMIVDLMRNDFHRICLSGSVEVPVAQELRSHTNVHHLHAKVTGRLQAGTTLASLISAVCPAGSITGAPKVEVMKAIAELEGRPRGYHMGHVFHWRPDGSFDSSVLIRTMVRQANAAYELAVGSGIVIRSNPADEMAEIMAKARVATASVHSLK